MQKIYPFRRYTLKQIHNINYYKLFLWKNCPLTENEIYPRLGEFYPGLTLAFPRR